MTEICVEVNNDIKEVENILEKVGFKFDCKYTNNDFYYTKFDKDFAAETSYQNLLNNSVIVREIKGDDFNVLNIVQKIKTLDENNNVIDEKITKLKIDEAQKAKTIFENLNFFNWCNLNTLNVEYVKDNITIIIQKTDNLGLFIEIEEYDDIKTLSSQQKFEKLKQLANSLNLNLKTDYSCKKVFMMYTKQNKK